MDVDRALADAQAYLASFLQCVDAINSHIGELQTAVTTLDSEAARLRRVSTLPRVPPAPLPPHALSRSGTPPLSLSLHRVHSHTGRRVNAVPGGSIDDGAMRPSRGRGAESDLWHDTLQCAQRPATCTAASPLLSPPRATLCVSPPLPLRSHTAMPAMGCDFGDYSPVLSPASSVPSTHAVCDDDWRSRSWLPLPSRIVDESDDATMSVGSKKRVRHIPDGGDAHEPRAGAGAVCDSHTNGGQLQSVAVACAGALQQSVTTIHHLRRRVAASHHRFSSAARRYNDMAVGVWSVVCTDHVGSLVTAFLSVRDQARMQVACHRFAEIGMRALRELRVCMLHVSATTVHPSTTDFITKRCPSLRELHVRRYVSSVSNSSSGGSGSGSGSGSADQRTPLTLSIGSPAGSPIASSPTAMPQSPSVSTATRVLSAVGVLNPVFTRCRDITTLSVQSGLDVLNDESLAAVATNCAHMNCVKLPGMVRLSDTGLAALCACTHLRVLDVSMAPNITDRGVMDVATWCVALEQLVLTKAPNVTDASLHVVGQRCHRLRDLRVSWCKGVTDAGMLSVADGCPSLEVLHASGCTGVTDTAIVALAQSCSSHLRIVDVSRCRFIRDASLFALAKHCVQLRVLDISACCGVTDTGVSAVAAHCPHLQKLDVSWGPRITDAGVKAVAASCTSIAVLNLSACVDVTDTSLLAVGAKCRLLRKLVVPWCHSVTDTGVCAAIGSALEVLNVAGCQRVSDATLMAAASKCSRLRKLNVSKCPGVSASGIAAVYESPQFYQLDVVS